MTNYRIDGPIDAELDPIKRSRFIGRLRPASCREDALGAVAALRRRYPDARHHAWAFRLGPSGDDVRCSDDGEPTGTAGPPILRALEQTKLTGCVAIVTRYSGGIKLGAGGLTRAYGAAARAAIEGAVLHPIIPSSELSIRCTYEDAPAVARVLEAAGLTTVAAYAEAVTFRLQCPDSDRSDLRVRLADATGGRAVTGPD